jgi:hypothetical protein
MLQLSSVVLLWAGLAAAQTAAPHAPAAGLHALPPGISPAQAQKSFHLDLSNPEVLAVFLRVLGRTEVRSGEAGLIRTAIVAHAIDLLERRKASPPKELSEEMDDLYRINALFTPSMRASIAAEAWRSHAPELPKAGLGSLDQAAHWNPPGRARPLLLESPESPGDREFERLIRSGDPEKILALKPGTRRRMEMLREEFLRTGDGDLWNLLVDSHWRSRLGFRTDGEFLGWIYPECRGAVHAFIRYWDKTSEGLKGSLPGNPAQFRAWAEHLRALEAFFPKAYGELSARSHQISSRKYACAVPEVKINPPEKVSGYTLPYSLDGTPAKAPEETAFVAEQTAQAGWLQELRKKHAAFNGLIEANFQILQSLASQAGGLTVASAGKLVEQARLMAGFFRTLCGPQGLAHLDNLSKKLEKGWKGLDPSDKVPSGLRESIFKLDPKHPAGSLHSLVNWMHQKAIAAAGSMDDDVPGGGTGSFHHGNLSLYFTYLGDAPLAEALGSNPAVKSLLPSLERIGSDPLVFDERRAWRNLHLGCHSAAIFADSSEPDDGGLLRIRYNESGEGFGSAMRMEMIAHFLSKLGIRVKVHGDQYLEAVWDKDNGLDSAASLAEAYPLILVFLRDTKNIDLKFNELSFAARKTSGRKIARRLADIYFAEGSWAQFGGYLSDLDSELTIYKKKAAGREALRARLDGELGRLGLPKFPGGEDFGQRAIELRFTRPIQEAAARGELSWDGTSKPERLVYSPLYDLARSALSEPGPSSRLAPALEFMDFEPIGMIGALRAERAQLRFPGGTILTAHALRDTESGRLAFARCSYWTAAKGPTPLDLNGLRDFLTLNGLHPAEEDGLSQSQLERLAALLKAPLPPDGNDGAGTFGLPASPGKGDFATGPLTFDREGRSQGSILAVPYTTPDDLEAISGSAGVLTTGGGALSHAAITTRELGLPSVILSRSRWTRDKRPGLDARLARLGQPWSLPDGLQAASLKTDPDPVLREGDLVRIDGRTGKIALVARREDSRMARAHEALERLRRRPKGKLRYGDGLLWTMFGRKPGLWPQEVRRFFEEEALHDARYANCRDGILEALGLPPGNETPKAAPPAPPPRKPDHARVEWVRGRKPTLLRLGEIDDGLKEFVGGKSAKLGEMISAVRGQGASVPDGIALTHWAFERFLEENKIKKPGRDAILAGRLRPDKGVGKEILDALRAGEGSRWAVRSSAIQEDGDDAAFAGAAESYLFVKPDEILPKVVENWASFWLPRGILYREQHGLSCEDILPATLIQEMVPAEKSGVVFTRNPVNSADEVVINAVYGLGEGAVSGQAEADLYTTRKSDGEETALPHVARKRVQILENGPALVPAPLRDRRVLSREQTRALSKIAADLERKFGRPMDIEFSIRDGRIVILQARPITTINI